jgi:hypothetical protein
MLLFIPPALTGIKIRPEYLRRKETHVNGHTQKKSCLAYHILLHSHEADQQKPEQLSSYACLKLLIHRIEAK